MQRFAPQDSVQNQLFVHFGLRENPFGGTPDPRFLFHSETHREALASLINGIDFEFGFQMLVAQPGMGKTTLLFNFLERFRAAAYTAFLFQPQPEPCELLQSLLFELGESSEDTSVRKLSEQLNQLLGRAAAEHKRVIVVVDEAQNLDFAVLETVRQLSNFETPQAKLMQIVLAGQPQLVKKLAAPEQEQLRQRISSIARLRPLTLGETRAYINHRLRIAGYRETDLFTPGAVRNIWENGKGVPRNINTLCFNAMLLASAGNQKSIDETILEEAARDLDMSSVLADMYRMEPSIVVSQPNSKVHPIRETIFSPTENAAPVNLAAAQDSLSPKAKIAPAATPSCEGKISGPSENIPLALVEAIMRINQTLEEQKALLAAQSVTSAASPPATVPVPAATVSAAGPPLVQLEQGPGEDLKVSGQAPQPPPSAPGPEAAAPILSDSLVGMKKESPPKPETSLASEQKTATVKPSQPEKITVEKSVLPEVQIVRRDHPVAQKPPARVRSWMKPLALAAVACVLIIALVEALPRQDPAQANAGEPGRSTSEEIDSASGHSAVSGSPTSPKDAPIRPSQGTAVAHATRKAGSDDFNDVTVRKFPAEPVVKPGTSTDLQASQNIFFDQDSAVIAEQYRLALQQVADALAKDPEATAILEGHTDDSGPEYYNLDLSSRRAMAVREALVNDFNVPGTRLTTIGSGSAAPVQPNSSADGRARNRCVSVRLVRLRE